MTARLPPIPSATSSDIVGITAVAARLLHTSLPCALIFTMIAVPGVGLVSSTISDVAAQPDAKTFPPLEMPTSVAVSNHEPGVGAGGSTFARQRRLSFRLNAVTQPSCIGSLQHPCENPDTTTRPLCTSMPVGNSAMLHCHPGVTYFQRRSPPGVYARTNHPCPSHVPRTTPIR